MRDKVIIAKLDEMMKNFQFWKNYHCAKSINENSLKSASPTVYSEWTHGYNDGLSEAYSCAEKDIKELIDELTLF